MIKKHKLVYYEWKDIEHAICDSLGIDHGLFRDYHKVVGGNYKDIWHLWLWWVSDDVHNGGYSRVFFDPVDEPLNDYFVKNLKKAFGDWSLDVVRHFDKVLNSLEENDDDSIVIHYEW